VNRILHLGTEGRRAFRRIADFHALHRLHRHDGLRQSAVEPRVPGNVRSQSRRHATRHHFENAADGVAGFIRLIDHRLHALLGLAVDAAQ